MQRQFSNGIIQSAGTRSSILFTKLQKTRHQLLMTTMLMSMTLVSTYGEQI